MLVGLLVQYACFTCHLVLCYCCLMQPCLLWSLKLEDCIGTLFMLLWQLCVPSWRWLDAILGCSHSMLVSAGPMADNSHAGCSFVASAEWVVCYMGHDTGLWDVVFYKVHYSLWSVCLVRSTICCWGSLGLYGWLLDMTLTPLVEVTAAIYSFILVGDVLCAGSLVVVSVGLQ